jgi:hypothetical protein
VIRTHVCQNGTVDPARMETIGQAVAAFVFGYGADVARMVQVVIAMQELMVKAAGRPPGEVDALSAILRYPDLDVIDDAAHPEDMIASLPCSAARRDRLEIRSE